MKTGIGIFRSRFARRLFTVFIVSAILPVLTLAALSFNRVADQLLEQNEQQQRQQVKTIGMAIYERLTLLQTELQMIASRRASDKNYLLDPMDANTKRLLDEKLVNIGWLDNRNIYTPLLHNGSHVMGLDAINQLPESSTEFTIITTPNVEGERHIFMLQPPNTAAAEDGILIAELNNEYLWNADIITASQGLCMLDHLSDVLFCSPAIPDRLIESTDRETADSFAGNYEWEDANNESHLVSYWSIFLRSEYGIDDWTVLTSVPRQEIVRPITDFQTPFILIFAVSLLIVLMLSSSQIQRILIPLRKLTLAVQDIGNSNFDSKVVIDSKDEFSDLADSFNTMGAKLSDQFQSLETMAEIDRLILSSQDAENIVQIVLVRIQEIIRCDQIGIASQDGDGQFTQMVMRVRQNEPEPEIIEAEIELLPVDHEFLEQRQGGALIELDRGVPLFLEPITSLGARVCLVLPLFSDDALSAIVVLGYTQLPENPEQLLQDTRSWADRVGVALSNARWQEKLYHQANFDALTGLPNRPAFKNYLQQALNRAERNKEMVGVLFIDLDRFKLVNDSLGHVVGDQYLTAIAERISQCVRSTDMLARLGGDEFTIVVSEDAQVHIKTSISAVADKLLEAIPKPLQLGGQELRSSASIGIAIYPLDADNIEDLMKNADSAMYHAKANVGGSYRYFSEELNLVISNQLRVEGELRKALRNDELTLYFQAKVDCHSGKLVGAEALLRWNHPEKGLVLPDSFVPQAEESRLIIDIDHWVLNAACAQLKIWKNEGRPNLHLATNLSARFFQLDEVAERLIELTEQLDVSMENLELEITEGTLIEDIDKALLTLKELKILGFQLTIDDFGTGYSSLSYLKQLPIHKLKIDQSFISNCADDEVDAALVKTIISMAHNLHLLCIAEGVETKEQLAFLRKHGCDQVQGYYYSKPLAARDFEEKYLVPASGSTV